MEQPKANEPGVVVSVLGALGTLLVWGGIGYVALHFLATYW